MKKLPLKVMSVALVCAIAFSAAACDVVSSEPMKADNPLLGAPNIRITPHMAWASVEARERLVEAIAQNISI